MAVYWLANTMVMDNARFRDCTKGCLTPRFLQALVTQFSSRVMDALLPVDTIHPENGIWSQGFATLPILYHFVEDLVIYLVMQLDFVCEDDAVTLTCSCLAGNEVLRLSSRRADSAWETHKLLARELNVALQSLRAVLS